RSGSIVDITLSALQDLGTYAKFMPKHFETTFRRKPRTNDEFIAQTLTTSHGITIKISGQIDRIDTYSKNDTSFVNIIDYNSSEGSATLDLTKVFYGMLMQMMTYMDIVLQVKQRRGLTDFVKPGGLLYFNVHEPRIKFQS
ncbi:PD-(D/E)XK nuclease family protein, partial [Staphylococcus aureus]|uniref:PD-(D/E)XK nuclease family protein n=1 Tax=Staphylococcus aureus TaxID=1280 RepID=UPI00210AAA15